MMREEFSHLLYVVNPKIYSNDRRKIVRIQLCLDTKLAYRKVYFEKKSKQD